MIDMKFEKDIQIIACVYGEKEQLIKTAEECAELGKAALKHRAALMDSENTSLAALFCSRKNLVGEIADVLVMIGQIIYLEGCEGDVRKVMAEKIDRQVGRIRVAKLTTPQWLEDEYGYCRCSRCGYEHDDPETTTPYCPGCGARMNGMTEVTVD